MANDTKTKPKKDEVIEEKSKKTTKEESALYFFYTQGCGWCKKVMPHVDELIKEGHEILKLDLADGDNQKLQNEVKAEYKAQCGTPWFVDAETGNQICGFREKDVLEKWLAGEDIPAPPRPKGPIPKIPLMGAPESEIKNWKKVDLKYSTNNRRVFYIDESLGWYYGKKNLPIALNNLG